jgi:hypothetical protein
MRSVFSLVFLLAAACASPPKAYIPVDSPLKPWEPPEADAYAAEPPQPEPAPTSTATPKPGAAKEKKAEKRP